MSVTPTLHLYVDSTNYDPPYYWMDVTVDVASGYEPVPGPIPGPATTSSPNQFHVDVDVLSSSGGSDTVEVDFGQITVDVQNDEIHAHLKNGSGVGSGIIRVQDAEERTKPLPE